MTVMGDNVEARGTFDTPISSFSLTANFKLMVIGMLKR
jgi:hypothetical protein